MDFCAIFQVFASDFSENPHPEQLSEELFGKFAIRPGQKLTLAVAFGLDIDRAAEALKAAKRPRIHTFMATSDIHLQYKLKKSREQVLEDVVNSVRLARTYCDDVEFSAEDATRTDAESFFKIRNRPPDPITECWTIKSNPVKFPTTDLPATEQKFIFLPEHWPQAELRPRPFYR